MSMPAKKFNFGKMFTVNLVAAGALWLAPPTVHASVVNGQDESIQVRSARYNASPLNVELLPMSDRYRVGEPMHFRVHGNRSFFLYLFNIDSDSGLATRILPNAQQKANLYSADRLVAVPEKTVEFIPDRVGEEKIIMVASTKPLQFDEQDAEKVGSFTVINREQLDRDLESIRERIGKKLPTDSGGDEIVIKELTLDVTERSSGYALAIK